MISSASCIIARKGCSLIGLMYSNDIEFAARRSMVCSGESNTENEKGNIYRLEL